MKTTVILLILSASLSAQFANIWQVTPRDFCPGDSVKVHYKLPAQPAQNHTFFLTTPYTGLGTFSNQFLQSRPTELVGSDVCHYIYLHIPQGVPVGTNSLTANASLAFNYSVTVKNCSCTITSAFNYTASYLNVQFESATIGATSQTIYNWDFGTGSGFQVSGTSPTFTYFAPGTYTVGLLVINPTCEDLFYSEITVELNTTGIDENQINQTPVYFDIYGNKTEPKAGTLLIKQIGNTRKKVLIQ